MKKLKEHCYSYPTTNYVHFLLEKDKKVNLQQLQAKNSYDEKKWYWHNL